MIWLLRMIFGRRDDGEEAAVRLKARLALEAYEQERLALSAKRREEQENLQRELGFEFGDGEQNWLRLHQILHDHEKRLRELEGQV